MKAAVLYYSRSGNTRIVAEAMADALGIKAVSVADPKAALKEKVDILFIGGAIYAYGLDKHMKAYLAGIDPAMVGRAAVFSTSMISKHGLALLRKALENKGIPVADETFYVKSRANKRQLREAGQFARRTAIMKP